MTPEEKSEQKAFIAECLERTGLSIEEMAARLDYKTLPRIRNGEFRLPDAKRRHMEDLVRLAELEEQADTFFVTPNFVYGSPVDKLRRAMEAKDMDAKAVAKALNVQIGVVQAVLTGHGQASENLIEKFVTLFPHLTKEDLMAGSDAPVVLREDGGLEGTFGTKPPVIPGLKGELRYIPLLSWTQAGQLEAHYSEGDTIFDRDRRTTPVVGIKGKAYALEVKGDSMFPEIKDGDQVVVKPDIQPKAGDTVIVQTSDGSVMCKVYQPKDSQHAIFISVNTKYPPFEVPRSEIEWMYPVKEVFRKY